MEGFRCLLQGAFRYLAFPGAEPKCSDLSPVLFPSFSLPFPFPLKSWDMIKNWRNVSEYTENFIRVSVRNSFVAVPDRVRDQGLARGPVWVQQGS